MITVSEFVKYMNIPTPISQDLEDFIKDCILSTVDEMNVSTNRILVEMNPSHDMTIIITEKTEYYDGFNSKIIYLNNHPIVDFGENSENSLKYLNNNREWVNILKEPDTIENSATVLTYGKLVLLKGYIFPTGTKNIKVVYRSGYSAETLPGDLKRVCYEKSGLKFLNSAFGIFQRLGLESYDFSNQKMKFKEEDFEKV